MMICGRQQPSVEPWRLEDGDCGVELHATIDSAGDCLLTADKHEQALLYLCQKTRETRSNPRNRKCILSMPGIGIATATCSVVHAGWLTMNVEVVLKAED